MNFVDYIKTNYTNSIHDGNAFLTYTNLEEELYVLKNGVGMRVTEQPTIIKMVGKDTVDFLQRVTTNDVKDLKPLTNNKTLFLNEKGRFIAQTVLLSHEGELWVLSDHDPIRKLFSWINKFIIMEDIKTEDISDKYSLLEFSGPQTKSFFMLLLGNEISDLDSKEFRRFDVDGFTFFLFKNIEANNFESIKVIIDSAKLIEFLDHLFKIKSVFDLSFVGLYATNTCRIEKLIPQFPFELTTDFNPHEVNLMKNICSTKGCYIGQEVVARLETYDKVQRVLVKVVSQEKVESNYKMILDETGEEAGEITTHGVYANSHGYASLCILKKKALAASKQFHILSGEKRISLKVVSSN